MIYLPAIFSLDFHYAFMDPQMLNFFSNSNIPTITVEITATCLNGPTVVNLDMPVANLKTVGRQEFSSGEVNVSVCGDSMDPKAVADVQGVFFIMGYKS